MLRRRAMMGTQKTEPYEMLNYIEATGTQYIDTGYNVEYTLPFAVEFDYQSLKQSGTSFQALFGLTVEDSASLGININIFSANNVAYNYIGGTPEHGGGGTITSAVIAYGSRDIWKLNRTEFSIKGTNNYSFVPATTIDYLRNRIPYIFARNQNNLEARALATGRIYYCKMWYNNDLVRDFVPVKRRSDGAIGLYDKVTDAFFGNAGTGSFIGG